MGELPMAPIERILKRNATGMHISKEAKELLAIELEKEGERLSRKALDLAQAENRKTVLGKDIKKWRTLEQTDGDDFLYKLNGYIRYNKDTDISCWLNNEKAKTMDAKFLDGVLLFDGRLYDVKTIDDARRIMELHVPAILDSLMQPHWAYNIYEYRDWRNPEKINDHTTRLTMWFDDYDGGDVFEEGFLFNKP